MPYNNHRGIEYSKLFPILWSILFCVILLHPYVSAQSGATQSCCNFTQPEPWISIKQPLCTLAIAPIFPIKSATFKARYFQENGSVPVEVELGTITRPPYKLIWDITNIPNQLTYGITCIVDVVRENGERETIQQEGIFLTHQEYTTPSCTINYVRNSFVLKEMTQAPLQSPIINANGKFYAWWNERGIHFRVMVANQLFYTSLPGPKLQEISLKVYIDARNRKRPYLTDDILIFVFPLPPATPYQLVATSLYNRTGTFEIRNSQADIALEHKVAAENFKGYTIDCTIPLSLLGKTRPNTIGCNIVAAAIDENTAIREMSWISGSGTSLIAPFSYGTIHLKNKPLLANSVIQFSIFFLSGFIFILILSLVVNKLRPSYSSVSFEKKERENSLMQQIETIIEEDLTKSGLTLQSLALRLKTNPNTIERMLRTYHEKNFNQYIAYNKIELAKERLRSSNASEASISRTCGFSSVSEMEELFRKYVHTTPYNFRKDHRIS